MHTTRARATGHVGGLLGLLLASHALGAERPITVAAGDCRSPELISATTTFAAAVVAKAGPASLTGEAVLEQLRPVPTLSSEELARRLEAAQAQFYAGAYDKALEAVRESVAAIERLSPRAQPWQLMSKALLLEALAQKSAGKKLEAVAAQRRVLRVDPLFKLDPDFYTPSTIQAFEALRKELAKAKKARLTIASTPSGADVFLDGAPVGKTPYAGELVPGEYRLTLASGDRLSFARTLSLTRDQAVQVDLAFEGALSPQAPLCLTGEPARAIDSALKLAALAGADSVVVLRLEARNNEPGWLTATLLEASQGSRTRDGGIRFTGPRRNDAVAELAGFVLTGNPGQAVIATLGANPLAPAPVVAVAAAPRAEVAAPPVTLERRTGRGVLPRVVGLALVGAGLVAAVSGAGLYAQGGSDRGVLLELVDEQGFGRPGANPEEVKGIQARVVRNSRASLGLGLTGAAALAAGAAIFFLFPPDASAPRAAVTVSSDGLWVGATLPF